MAVFCHICGDDISDDLEHKVHSMDALQEWVNAFNRGAAAAINHNPEPPSDEWKDMGYVIES